MKVIFHFEGQEFPEAIPCPPRVGDQVNHPLSRALYEVHTVEHDLNWTVNPHTYAVHVYLQRWNQFKE